MPLFSAAEIQVFHMEVEMRISASLCSLLFCCIFPTLAGIQLDSTRIIYPADKHEVTLGLTNHTSTPRLIQTWIDAGDSNAKNAAVPFFVTPPIFRLDPEKGHSLRIVHTAGALPQDRESVFWLNVLEIQPKSVGDQADKNSIKVTIRIRLKIFFRPKGLVGSPDEAVSQLRWRRVTDDKGVSVACDNPTPWNVSFNHIGLKNVPVTDDEKQSGMCPARGSRTFTLTGSPETDGKLTLITIDDFGSYHKSSAMLAKK
jgi:chaperone protein EcpD